MATLTETATLAKNLVLRLGQIFAVILVLFLAIRFGSAIFRSFVPSSPAPATVAFSKLPVIDLSEGEKIPAGMEFKIETITGDIPGLAQSAKVFTVKKNEATFGILEEANKKAASLGFSQTPTEVNMGLAKYIDSRRPDKLLTVETATDNFNLQSDFLADKSIISTRPKSLEDATNMAFAVLGVFGISEKNYPLEKVSTISYKIEGSNLTSVSSLSQANIVRVVFGRVDLDNLPIFYINFEDPLVWGLVREKEVLAAEKTAREIEKFKFATYPLKGAKAAFEQLKGGQGVLNKVPSGNTFVIRNVKVGYVEGRLLQDFLQPVYIFESDNNLKAFIGAVGDDWTYVPTQR